MSILAAFVWHFWLGIFLLLGTVLTVVLLAIGYLVKVQSLRYPKR